MVFPSDAAFFAYSWKLPTYSGAFLLTIDSLSSFAYNWSFFAYSFSFFKYSWNFFACSGKVRLIRALRDCKQRSLTVSKKAPTVSKNWRQIWRVAGRESGSPELLGSPRTSPEVPRTSPEVFGDFPGSSLTVELNSNPEVLRKFPKLPRKFPKLPRKFRDFPGGQPLSLGRLTPSPDSQKLSLKKSCLVLDAYRYSILVIVLWAVAPG